MSTRTRVQAAGAVSLILAALVVGGWALLRPPTLELPESLDVDESNQQVDLSATRTRPPRPSQGYVGTAECCNCHDDICGTYQMHSMGHSTAHVDDVARIEDFTDASGFDVAPNFQQSFDLQYLVSEVDGIIYHHERATAPDGTIIYDQAVPVDFAVGSGTHGRSYITNRDGILLMSPVSWYSHSQRWDLSPGYQNGNEHFERRILDGCVHCHVGRLAPAEGLQNQFDPEQPILEGAISCERCHGPGDQHVAHQQGDLDVEDVIVNPKDLEPHLRDSVCYQCHFHGVERVVRYGKSEYDFRPGDDLCDNWVVFVHETDAGQAVPTEAVSQTEQMLSSVCYQQSAGRLGCVSCHDPHSLPADDQRIDFYRSRCLNCHEADDSPCSEPLSERLVVSPADSCIDCHMPSIAAGDVPHTSQTDHRIVRAPRDELGRPEGLITIFREESGVIPAAELERARAIFMVKQARRLDNTGVALDAIDTLRAWLRQAPDDLLAIEALGLALYMGKETNASVTVWEQGLALDPNHENLLRWLMTACHDYGQVDLGVTYGRRLVEVNPWNSVDWGRLAHLLSQQGNLEEGIEAAERACAIRPSNAITHGWLAEAYKLTGNDERAAEHQKIYDYLTAGE